MRRLIIILLTGLAWCGGAAAQDVPLPLPRPPDAVVAEILPSACQLRLAGLAQFERLADRAGPGACGGRDLVRLSAVQMPDNTKVTIAPAAELRCEMAEEVAHWVREAAAAEFAPAILSGIDNFDSYDCRGRNRVAGAKVSEHGRGNALDIRAFRLAGGKMVMPTDVNVAHALRADLREAVCARFTTVLGPGSDGFHEGHIHLDLAARRAGYRICQWAVRDPAPVEARAEIPLPQPRPTPPGNDKPSL